MKLRIADAADTPDVRRIVADAYTPYIARIGREPAPMGDDYPALIRDGLITLAVDEDGHILGLLVLRDCPDHLLLDNIAVAPAAQGRGVGGMLMRHAEAEARRRGYAKLRLYTNAAMTENIARYIRAGFVETGRGGQDGFQRVFFAKVLPP